jgi:hypothetical protein
MYPSHEAFRLLNKWKNEKTAIRLILTLSFGAVSCVGNVVAVEGANVRFLSADASSELMLSLAAASFEYRAQREQTEATYRRSLMATFPSQARIGFFQLP